MISQAVDAARYGESPPPELILAWQCGDARLPEAGGIYDQDAVLWSNMQTLLNVHRLTTKIINLKGEKIHTLSAAERKAWRALIDAGVW